MELVAGLDEVGRGAWFGPVVAAAVIMPLGGWHSGITDSKKLSPRRRRQLVEVIKREAIAWGIGVVDVAEIDRFNILQASLLAMERGLAGLGVVPHHCLVDGRDRLRWREVAPIPQTTIVGGDGLSMAIGAASIVAKVYRDDLIGAMASIYRGYDLENNKGYGTPKHRQGIAKLGLTDQHRRSFRLL